MINFSFSPEVYESELQRISEKKDNADNILRMAKECHPTVPFPISRDGENILYRIVHFSGDVQITHLREQKDSNVYDPTISLKVIYELSGDKLVARYVTLSDFFETNMNEKYSPSFPKRERD